MIIHSLSNQSCRGRGNSKQIKRSRPAPTLTKGYRIPYLRSPQLPPFPEYFLASRNQGFTLLPRNCILACSDLTRKNKDPSTRAADYRSSCECGKAVRQGKPDVILLTTKLVDSRKIEHTEDTECCRTHGSYPGMTPRRIREGIEIYKHNTVPQDIGFHINDISLPLFTANRSPITVVRSPTPLALVIYTSILL